LRDFFHERIPGEQRNLPVFRPRR